MQIGTCGERRHRGGAQATLRIWGCSGHHDREGGDDAAFDRIALRSLASREDVDPDRLAAIGFSGGGARAAFLQSTADGLAACVVAGMMSTYEGLLDRSVAPHTWMLFPPGWTPHGDWPDLAACAAPSSLLVQYAADDALFSLAGMRDADRRIAAHYAAAGAPDAYTGAFYPGPHRFDRPMQDAAFAWLRQHLGR
jgi:predicted esterase